MNIFKETESEVQSYARSFPRVFHRAQGEHVFDEEGNSYLDFLAGAGALNYGHNNALLKEKLLAYIADDGITHGLDMHSRAKAEFLEALRDKILARRGLDYRVQFTGPTGTNAVELALKLARKVTGRRNIVAFTNGFHGMTMGALSCTGNSGKRKGAGGQPLCGTTHMPYEHAFGSDMDSLRVIRQMLANGSSGMDAPAAFIIEPVQGEGGLNAASTEFLQGVAALAKEYGALLIVDDIQSGCGRTGTFFSFEEMGIEPDLIPMAKSFSGMGLPFAALLIKREHDIWKPAEHNGTFRGNTHAFVTARIALEKFWKDDTFQKAINAKAEILETALKRITEIVPGSRLKGRGMMRGVDVGSGDLAEKICARAFEKGLVIETSGADDEVVKVLAPLTTPEDMFQKGLDILVEAVKDVAETHKVAAE